ncbi:MAG: tetratricopeptide repeat protein [Candidatus Zixiibacteriota bacterium]|jgi:Flp pilus assembly protein TadD
MFGIDFLRSGQYQNALRAFEESADINPDEVRALLGRSVALTRLGRYDEALEVAFRIARRDPDSPYAYNAQAVCFQAMGRLEEAEKAFKLSVKYGPDIPGNIYNFACYWAARDDVKQCRKFLEKAIELDSRLNVIAATDVDFSRYRSEDWFLDVVAFK